ncbi:MAG: hypothetical protein LIO93_01510 [Bacteroidales bacterium]|nr:hypothetical protein [Bacteroidales bacterium]
MKKLFFLLWASLISFGVYAQAIDFPIEKIDAQVGHWTFDANGIKQVFTASSGISLTATGDQVSYVEEDGVWATQVINTENDGATANYFTLTHDLPATNDGSTEILDYCLVMDVKFDLQTAYIPLMWNHSYEGDADIFVKKAGSMGLQGGGLNYTKDNFVQVGWNRIIINANLSDMKITFFTIYPDGTINMDERTVTETNRFSMRTNSPTDIFRDNGNEDGDTYISQCALYNKTLTGVELESVGISGLIVTPDNLDFGYVQIGTANGSSMELDVQLSPSASGNIEAIFDPEYLYVDTPPITENTGKITVFFMPTELKEYNLSFTLKSGGDEVEIPVKGIGAPNVPIEADTWYRIQFIQRTGYCLTDMGVENPLEATMYEQGNDAQLWKFELESENTELGIKNYRLTNKSGRTLYYRYENEEEEIKGRFLSAASSNNTYSFQIQPGGDWQILWNEYETTENGNTVQTGAHINKTADDTQFTAYNYMPDPGSAVAFYKENETIDIGLPEFCTANDPDPKWYYIQFKRVLGKGFNYGVISSDEINTENSALKQGEIDPQNPLMKWKFVGDMDSFRIVDVNDNEWGESSVKIVGTGEGIDYKMEGYGVKSWCLLNIESGKYVNDLEGSSSKNRRIRQRCRL